MPDKEDIIKMKKAVFLDRDGVICKEVNYLHRKEDFELIPRVAEGIKLLNNDYLVIIITNQAAVARGICTEEDVSQLNNYMINLFQEEGAKIDGIYYCPHHPKEGKNPVYTRECECRKPLPGMILQAQKDFNIQDLSKCFLVGDKNGDILAGKRAGCKTILVKTGYGGKGGDNVDGVKPDYLTEDLFSAVAGIILTQKNLNLRKPPTLVQSKQIQILSVQEPHYAPEFIPGFLT